MAGRTLMPALYLVSNMHIIVCSGSVVVTAYDSESGRLGSNPEWD